MKWFVRWIVLPVILIAISLANAQESNLYDDSKVQCLDRLDKEDCLAYFDKVLNLIESTEDHWQESLIRKENRYDSLKEQEAIFQFFREEWDYAARRIDKAKVKRLRSLDLRARQSLKESKESAAIALQEYHAEKDECNENCEANKRLYAYHLTSAVLSAVSVMQASLQRSPYITENDASVLNSKLNQLLAYARLLRSRFTTGFSNNDVGDFRKLLTEAQNINTEIALLHTKGELYSISRKLATMHLKWERKALHAFAVAPAIKEELSKNLGLFADSLDNAFAELLKANELMSPFDKSNTKKVLGYLSKAYQHLQATTKEQKTIMLLLQNNGIHFSNQYDSIEEVQDNHVHGLSWQKENEVSEDIIIAKLYPERGETVIEIFNQRHSFPTIEEDELVKLIAKEINATTERIKHQLRFEIGGK